MAIAKVTDLLQKVNSVIPKLTSGMHKVSNFLQGIHDDCQRVRPASEGEECHPQSHQWYAQSKQLSTKDPLWLPKSQTCSGRWIVSSPSSPVVCTRWAITCKGTMISANKSDLLLKVKNVIFNPFSHDNQHHRFFWINNLSLLSKVLSDLKNIDLMPDKSPFWS